MSENLKLHYKTIRVNAKGPLWQFSGLASFICFIGFAIYAGGRDKENTKKSLGSPAVGDIYEYRANNGSYSTMKLRNITNDSLFLSLNDYEIDKRARLYKIDKEQNYSETTYGYSKIEITLMQAEGIILEINCD